MNIIDQMGCCAHRYFDDESEQNFQMRLQACLPEAIRGEFVVHGHGARRREASSSVSLAMINMLHSSDDPCRVVGSSKLEATISIDRSGDSLLVVKLPSRIS